MISTIFASGPVSEAALNLLRAYIPLTTLVPVERITDDAGARPTPPYILVESVSEVPYNTMGPRTSPKFGSSVRFTVRAVSQYRGDAEVNNLGEAIRGGLDGEKATVAGWPGKPLMTWEAATMLKTTVNGVVTRELVMDFNVVVHQSN